MSVFKGRRGLLDCWGSQVFLVHAGVPGGPGVKGLPGFAGQDGLPGGTGSRGTKGILMALAGHLIVDF